MPCVCWGVLGPRPRQEHPPACTASATANRGSREISRLPPMPLMLSLQPPGARSPVARAARRCAAMCLHHVAPCTPVAAVSRPAAEPSPLAVRTNTNMPGPGLLPDSSTGGRAGESRFRLSVWRFRILSKLHLSSSCLRSASCLLCWSFSPLSCNNQNMMERFGWFYPRPLVGRSDPRGPSLCALWGPAAPSRALNPLHQLRDD